MMMDIQDMSRTARSTVPHLASAIVPTTRGITAMGTARALVANCSSQESFSIGQLRPVHASLSIGSLVVEKDIDDATDTCAAALPQPQQLDELSIDTDRLLGAWHNDAVASVARERTSGKRGKRRRGQNVLQRSLRSLGAWLAVSLARKFTFWRTTDWSST